MKFFSILGAAALLAACNAPKQEAQVNPIPEAPSYDFLVGTYTDSLNHGINFLSFSPAENLMTVETIAAGIANPSFVVATRDGKTVYSLEEEAGKNGGKVLTFSRNPSDNSLTLTDQDDSMGDHPCHISISPDEDFLLLGNYSGGSLSVFKVSSEQKLDFVQLIQHTGKSVNPERQEKPHVHSTTFDPEGKRVLVADLGTDKVYVYDFDASKAEPLALSGEFPMTPGDGPRHLAFSADGKEVLVVEEMTAMLDVFSYENGKLAPKQRLSLLDEGFSGGVGAAEIRLSPDGKNVYVSNRGDANTISVFAKNAAGEYERIQNIPSGGLMPRNFNLTADGKYLLSAHQASHDIVIFERDPATGKLAQTPWKADIHKPVYLHRLGN
ncbi:lactonase family protein [Algoriphagus sp. H41]|uniref:Lactonase family protein n=1 Tax=Algoriphagus oliviformis TaxID=2811231 RepID=A0ABS3C6P9_9BACT|nr:lactonase family protein [Algoriphagus oliviformis]MBN7812798.1 lactonase family protein [Algoriphagus oliviformis]